MLVLLCLSSVLVHCFLQQSSVKIQFIYFRCLAAEMNFSKPGGAAIIISHYFSYHQLETLMKSEVMVTEARRLKELSGVNGCCRESEWGKNNHHKLFLDELTFNLASLQLHAETLFF